MVKHAARLSLLALLVFAAAVHVSADLTMALAKVEDLLPKVELARRIGGGPRKDQASRSDVTSCWVGSALTCKFTARCSSSQCDCCGCPCATLDCWFNTIKATYNTAAKAAPLVKTAAQRAAVGKTFCDLARANGKFAKGVIDLYKKAKCPGYTAKIRAITGYQTNYNKWCKAFTG